MQSIAWSTVFLLVLLLPGFFFFAGLYAPERFARDLGPRNALGGLAATVLVAFLVHAASSEGARLLGRPVDWAAVLEAMQLPSPAGGAGTQSGSVLARVAARYAEAPLAIPLYVLLTCALGRFAGRVLGTLAVRGWLPSLNAFPWVYRLRAGDGGRLTIAHVLSDVSNGGRHLLYRGRLRHFGLNADGTFAYVVLASAEQRLLLVDGEGVDVPRPGPREPIGTNGGAPASDVDPPVRTGGGPLRRTIAPRLRDALEFAFGVTWRPASPQPEDGAVLMIAGSRIRDVVFQGQSIPYLEPARDDVHRLLDTLEEMDAGETERAEETLLRALSAAARERLRAASEAEEAAAGDGDDADGRDGA